MAVAKNHVEFALVPLPAIPIKFRTIQVFTDKTIPGN